MSAEHRFELSGPDKGVVLLTTAVVGAVAVMMVPTLSALVDRHGLPFPSWLHSVVRLDADWLTWGRPLIGLVLGLLAGLMVIDQAWSLVVNRDCVVAKRGADVRRIPHDRVEVVYRSGRRTVMIEGVGGARLFAGTVEGERAALPKAFAELGYPWEGEV